MNNEMFTMSLCHADAETVRRIVNRGIDSRLEGFTRSSFGWSEFGKLDCQIHPSELQVLIRRLLEDETEDAEMLADSIVSVEYGVEVY